MKKSRLKTATVQFRDEPFTIREVSHSERNDFLKRSEEAPRSVGAMLTWMCTLSEDGSRLFSDEAAVDGEPSGLVDFLSREILRLSGVPVDDKPKDDAAKKEP